jgi:hypothetical protein
MEQTHRSHLMYQVTTYTVCIPVLTKITYLITCLLIYIHTPWSGVPLEKLTVPQLVKKFPALYGTQRFTSTITKPATCPFHVYTNNITFSFVYFSITFLYCGMAYETQQVSKLLVSLGNKQKPIETLSRFDVSILVLVRAQSN